MFHSTHSIKNLTASIIAFVTFANWSIAQTTVVWSSASGSAWLTGTNWIGSSVPGTLDLAQFGVNPTSATTGVGINMNGSTNNGPNNQAVGGVVIFNTRTNNFSIGNSTTAVNGTLTFNGASVNSINNTIVFHNGGTAASPTTFTVQNIQGSGNKLMNVALPASTTSVVQIATGTGLTGSSYGNTVAITSNISGASSAMSLLGGGDSTNRGGTLILGRE
jgi:hypothetical protein